jgi:pyruvate/2-oxoglutarate/acetoin dehydrogenase E1 component
MRNITFSQAVREALAEEMRRDRDVFLIGEDIGVYGGVCGVTKGLIGEFGGERVMETPISELGFSGMGIGAAITGSRPVVEIMFSDFASVAFDQIVNQAAKIRFMSGGSMHVPIVFRMAYGSGTGAAAQHSQCPESWFANVPGLKIVIPSDAYDAKGLLKAAVRDNDPVLFFEHKLLYGDFSPVPGEEYLLPIGKACIKQKGEDVTVVSYGRMASLCLEAAEMLRGSGVSAEVIDLRTLVPLDKSCIIESVKKTGRLLIVHEAPVTGGFGGEIAAAVTESAAFHSLKAPVVRLCGRDCPMAFSPELEKGFVPGTEGIVKAARELAGK